MTRPSPLRWIVPALAGLAIAAGASVAASRLAGQHIGLESEPIAAGDRLVPHGEEAAPDRPRRAAPARTTPPTTPPPRSAAPAPTSPEPIGEEAGERGADGDD